MYLCSALGSFSDHFNWIPGYNNQSAFSEWYYYDNAWWLIWMALANAGALPVLFLLIKYEINYECDLHNEVNKNGCSLIISTCEL